ncbi:MAG: sarcosine oxidase subunit gamma [Mesorhizobium sp.]|nr:sarcosine oxidase subunit gamma [Mesorhizobium sp.]
MADASRAHPLAGRKVANSAVTLTPAEPAARLSLRARPDGIAALSKALGVKLPAAPKTSATSKSGARVALWLGPDEWLVIDTGGGDPAADCAKATALHSAVDISHRNTAIMVEGKGAEATLSAGCPQDLSRAVFPVGACSRTILGKIEVVVWRTGETAFRVECWRSFSTYAFDFLEEAARDAAIAA